MKPALLRSMHVRIRLVDRLTGRVFAARDHLGSSHFTMRSGRRNSIFASEIKALVQCPFLKVARDRGRYRNPSGSCCRRIPARGDQEAPPAPTAWFYDDGRTETRPYWR